MKPEEAQNESNCWAVLDELRELRREVEQITQRQNQSDWEGNCMKQDIENLYRRSEYYPQHWNIEPDEDDPGSK